MNYTYPQQPYNALQNMYGYTPRQQMYGNWPSAGVGPLPQVRPVSSIEEVRASPIDFDGSVFYFPDIANKRIYTKQINLDGTALLNMYVLQSAPVVQPQSFENYVSQSEFQQALNELLEEIEKLKGVKKNDQPISDVSELKF